jgi:non-ribosomal peptide synthase protein (TIGR01720 family)
MMLELHRSADAARLDAVVHRLVEHHDALRLRFLREGSAWRQYNSAPDGSAPFTCIDLAALPDEMWRPALEQAADHVQRSLDLSAGPLLRVVLLDRGSRGSSRLLLVVHHLAIDGVSWDVLLEDLARGYEQLSSRQAVELPAKTTSFRRWARWLRDRAASEEAKGQLAHWLRVPQGGRLLLATEPLSGGGFPATGDVMAMLEPEETLALIQEAPQAYHTQMDDLLLTALARALRSLLGDGLLLVDLEGHGREPVLDIDLSRTVGWFTTIFPVWLGPVLEIKQVKEQLRSVPNRGLDFGVLRYLSEDASVRERLRALPAAELRFNYLGRLDGAASGTAQFSPAPEGRGVERSPQAPVRYLLDLVAWVSGGRLQIFWLYDARRLRRQVVDELARRHVQELRAIVEHCRSVETGSYTPSDFPEAGLTQEALDTLMEQLGEAGDL